MRTPEEKAADLAAIHAAADALWEVQKHYLKDPQARQKFKELVEVLHAEATRSSVRP